MLAADGRGEELGHPHPAPSQQRHGLPLVAVTSARVIDVGADLAGECRVAVCALDSVGVFEGCAEGS
jgi:hypothetical protein